MGERCTTASLILLFMIISKFSNSSAEYVPVFAWKTTLFPQVVPALETLTQESFRNILLDSVTEESLILVFVEQNLSPEDFGLHDVEGTIPFHHLSFLKDSMKISYWSSVKNPIKVVKDLPGRTIKETSVRSILDNSNLKFRSNSVLLIDLNDATEDEDRLQMLQRHDKFIIDIYNKLSKYNENIVALFTGRHSSWAISEEPHYHRTVRDTGDSVPKPVANDTEGPGIIYSTEDILIYVNSVPTLYFNEDSVTLDNFNIASVRTEEHLNATLSSNDNKNVIVTFNFQFAGGYFILDNVMAHNENKNPKDYSLWAKNVYAPERFSYHCASQSFIYVKDTQINLTLPGFQFQIYFPNEESPTQIFGDAYDCVGFTSVPIWSGLFVTFILVIIMTFGLTMMMDIKTMDRFDDPKSKTITINVAE